MRGVKSVRVDGVRGEGEIERRSVRSVRVDGVRGGGVRVGVMRAHLVVGVVL